MTPEALVAAYRAGDRSALDRLVRDFDFIGGVEIGRLYAPGLDRDDLLQEARMAIVSAADSYDGSSPFRTFAWMVVRRRLWTTIKTATRMKHAPLNGFAPLDDLDEDGKVMHVNAISALDPPRVADGREEIRRLRRGFRILTDLERGAILGVKINGDSYDETAARLGTHPKAIDNALGRARRKLLDAA
jgi:RNA polymerase sporulation-specific sigma factor